MRALARAIPIGIRYSLTPLRSFGCREGSSIPSDRVAALGRAAYREPDYGSGVRFVTEKSRGDRWLRISELDKRPPDLVKLEPSPSLLPFFFVFVFAFASPVSLPRNRVAIYRTAASRRLSVKGRLLLPLRLYLLIFASVLINVPFQGDISPLHVNREAGGLNCNLFCKIFQL
jgi:hypothetical protein